MNERPARVSREAFERRYQRQFDPWDFAASPYERERYALTLAALRRRRYGAAFEPGCSVGELTALLAERCSAVTATDIAPSAVARARQRCAGFKNVQIHCCDLAEDQASSPLGLIVFSEVGYYFRVPQLTDIAGRLAARLEHGGEFIAVHWLGSSPDHLLHGDSVHEGLKSGLPLAWLGGARHGGFRIDSWTRR